MPHQIRYLNATPVAVSTDRSLLLLCWSISPLQIHPLYVVCQLPTVVLSGGTLPDRLSWCVLCYVSGPPTTLNSTSCNRLIDTSPHHCELCSVEEGVKRTGDQPGHGLHNGLLWVKHHRRE